MKSISIELSMPTRPDLGEIRERLARLPPAVDRVVLTDNHTGIGRLSPLAAVSLVLEAGRACSVCASARDRNRLALFAHVTGAVALGADEIVCVGGDRVADIPRRDLSVIELIARAHEWVQAAARIGAGCAARLDPAGHVGRITRRKVEAGAGFLLTQPCFDPVRAAALAAAISDLGPEPVVGVPLVTTPAALGALSRWTGAPPRWVAELVGEGEGVEVARRVLAPAAVDRVHIYPIGAGAWQRLADALA